MADPELGPKLLSPIKSQGVRELDDSAMIMRVKFKTIPGEQFGIRREVLRLLQEAFKKHGIEFAHRNVTVYLPQEDKDTEDSGAVSQPRDNAPLAAAAVRATLDEEEAKKKTPK